ncbi:response regulator transcription factor [Pseudobacteroides cellulosolvens]|uniref:Stage 0 sporulation protein A homolog n=1 Tax=Pseudobacteroides cellulosolvens ATCC 35603 = DSM 2933 TaxID=398512 RepID=A0A0L6JHD4_9FIRM|nr:response regulator transcription factor [Pseudobacteroides cellulosolvens]KNY25246.1 two component transcriptional regulator, LuxR family [Pseudobacteroides cellulosolvens ATCC 35603 = DSM 2933]
MIKVVIAEDMDMLRESLKYVIESDADMEVVGLAANGRMAYELCKAHKPDIVLMDIIMPECDGLEGTKLIKSAYPDIKVLILTTFEDDKSIIDALECGVDGYITKDMMPMQLKQSIKSVIAGLGIMKKNIMYSVADRKYLEPEKSPSAQVLDLTSKEKKLISLIVEGKSYKEMGREVGLSEGYVRNMISETLIKLNLKDRVQLAVFAVKNKIV